MTSPSDLAQRSVPQRRHRHRQRVVRVGLVRAACTQHTCSRRQRCRHINDCSPDRNKLLGQQEAHPVSSLDRPRAALERRCPRQQVAIWVRVARTLSVEIVLVRGHRPRQLCDALCGSTPMITCMSPPCPGSCGDRGGHSYLQIVRARSSLEPHHGEIAAGHSSFESQTNGRQALREQPDRTSRRYETSRHHRVSSRHFRDVAPQRCRRCRHGLRAVDALVRA